MTYEKIDKNNIDELARIFMNAFNTSPWEEEWTMEDSKRRILYMIGSNNHSGMVSRKDGNIVAFIIGHFEEFYTGLQFVIDDFCTDPNHHGRGYGKALLDNFSDSLREKGVKKIILNTLNTASTEGFYKKRGYETLENMIVMSRDLT